MTYLRSAQIETQFITQVIRYILPYKKGATVAAGNARKKKKKKVYISSCCWYTIDQPK